VTHFHAGKDFLIADMVGGHSGRLINVEDLKAMGARKVFIRYLRLTRVTAVKF
jgi:hypothetical protein